jgi:DNA-binding GntR family transcriptional regulator
LGVSRTPIRAALRRLAEEGLVELIPNKGAVVIGVTADDLIDTYKIRMRLEGIAAAMASRCSSSVKDIDVKALRGKLLENGAVL